MLTDDQTIYHIILASFVMPILLAGLLIWFFISYQKKKFQNETDKKDAILREQALLIERQQAVENERTRIASEMHDDLGSGLTTIRYLSDKALLQAKDAGEAEQITRIAEHSNRLVRNMSEIIWAMNARFDNAESLVSYLRRYASEFLEEYHMPLRFSADQERLDLIPLSGEKRRNIFLVFKEILHNTIKYARATAVTIEIRMEDELFIRIIEEKAVGFDPEVSMGQGNGLYNIQKRLEAIDGTIQYNKFADGMQIVISIPQHSPGHGKT